MTPLRKQYVELLTLRGYALRTHESYIGAVVDLARHFHCSPDQLSNEQVRDYVLSLHQRGLSRNTINVRISALRVLYEGLLKRPLTGIEESLPRPRRGTRRARVYSREELRRLFIQGCRNLRQRVFLMTVYGAGLRMNEACHLRVSDIDADRMMVRIRGKGDKERYTILSPWLLVALRRYWQAYQPAKPWLFPATRRPEEPLGEGSAQMLFYTALKQAGLPNKGGIHCLRHSFATHLLEDGVDLITLKKLLGHAYFATTAGYLHVTAENKVKVRSPLDVLPPNPATEGPKQT